MTNRKATIVRVTNGGVVYAGFPHQENQVEELAGFSFGKIAGYRGETAQELGLKPGKTVSIAYDEGNKINFVNLLEA